VSAKEGKGRKCSGADEGEKGEGQINNWGGGGVASEAKRDYSRGKFRRKGGGKRDGRGA